MSAGQPKHPIRSQKRAMSYEARNETEECLGSTMAGRSRALFEAIVRQKKSEPKKENIRRWKMSK